MDPDFLPKIGGLGVAVLACLRVSDGYVCPPETFRKMVRGLKLLEYGRKLLYEIANFFEKCKEFGQDFGEIFEEEFCAPFGLPCSALYRGNIGVDKYGRKTTP